MQVASGNAVVVGWVTFERQPPISAPVVSVLGGAEVRGVTHKHAPCSYGAACTGDGYNATTGKTEHPFTRPPYYMHFVRLGESSSIPTALPQHTRTYMCPYKITPPAQHALPACVLSCRRRSRAGAAFGC